MKKLLLLALAITGMAAAGCRSDNDANYNNPNNPNYNNGNGMNGTQPANNPNQNTPPNGTANPPQ
jgi:hypothetical protein